MRKNSKTYGIVYSPRWLIRLFVNAVHNLRMSANKESHGTIYLSRRLMRHIC